jgi:hypothetical protein
MAGGRAERQVSSLMMRRWASFHPSAVRFSVSW